MCICSLCVRMSVCGAFVCTYDMYTCICMYVRTYAYIRTYAHTYVTINIAHVIIVSAVFDDIIDSFWGNLQIV